jgi:hypothetical protein
MKEIRMIVPGPVVENFANLDELRKRLDELESARNQKNRRDFELSQETGVRR